MKQLHLIYIAAVALLLSAFQPADNKFTPAEQQQISIETPGLFARSDAFTINLNDIAANEYSFPLPVGKATLQKNQTVEIVTKSGDIIKAMFAGTVRLARKMPDRGNVIVIRHANGLETVYENNAQNLVKQGQTVKAGQRIAIVGGTADKAFCVFSVMVNGGRILPELVFELKSHKLRKQVLLCKKSGNFVDVSAESTKEKAQPKAEQGAYDKDGNYVLNLSTLKKETWAFPLPGCKVISPYGGRRNHSGVDIKTKANDNIYAAFDGIVTRSAPHFGYGNCIVIKHFEGFETLYSHQSKNLVKTGQKVKAGEIIGLTGRTGRATTEHLHFETLWKGRRFNPAIMYDCTAHKLKNVTVTFGKNGRVSAKAN